MITLDIAKIKITNRCNRNCQFCVFHTTTDSFLDLSVNNYKKMIDILRNVPIKKFHINGGEPLLHKDFIEMTVYSKEMLANSKMVLGTNGILLHKNEYLLNFIKDNYDEICIGCDLEHNNIDILEDIIPLLLESSNIIIVINSIIQYCDAVLLERLERLKEISPERIILVKNQVYHIIQDQPQNKLSALCSQEGNNVIMIQEDGSCYRCFNASVPDDIEFSIWDEDFIVKIQQKRTKHYKYCMWCRKYTVNNNEN